MSSKARAFCFTLNNYTAQHEQALKDLDCQYIVFGHEVGEQGTPHLQGYVYFTNPRSVVAVRKLFPWHVEVAKGDADQNRDYCTKDDDFYEKGVKPISNNQKGVNERERFRVARAAAAEGRFADVPDDIYIRYYGAIKRIRQEDAAPACKTKIENLRPWQATLKAKLEKEPDDRKIMWFVDSVGGQGKTEFAKWAVVNMNAHIVHNGKTADIAYGLPAEPKIVILDYTRSMEEHVNYGVLESIKNGMVFSSKYESRMKCFTTPHVVVFSNFEPNLEKLSADRWDIVHLMSPQCPSTPSTQLCM